jgi:hypothetical protein
MPIMLREAAVSWGDLALANNDVVLEVVTPRSSLEVKVFDSQRAYEAWDKEFRNRKTFDWDAFVFWVPPDKKADKDYLLDVRAAFHIHMIAKLTLGQGLLVEKILPKSAHERAGRQVNLADEPLDRWDGLVAGMDARTKVAVERFRTHYIERFLARQ